MNNDLQNNHSSMSSNKYIANNYAPLNRFIQESYAKDKNKSMFDTQSKGNKNIFFDSDNDRRPSNQKDLLISKEVSKYPNNYAAGPDLYNNDIVKGYYVNQNRQPRFIPRMYQQPLREIDEENPRNDNYYGRNFDNYGDEVEEEEGNEGEDEEEENEYMDVSPQKPYRNYNEKIGDGIVRNNIPNYSPNPNGQNIGYYQKKNLGKYNSNYNNNYGPDNENNNDDEYVMESPTKTNNLNNYNNYSREPYKRKHILGNLGDSASSEAYAIKNNQRSPNTDNSSSRLYARQKPISNSYNNDGISTEERGIESKKDLPNSNIGNKRRYLRRPYNYLDSEENEVNQYNKMNNYDEDSINVVEPPIYNFPNNEKNKGGKVDLNNLGMILTKSKKDDNEESKDLEDKYDIDEEKKRLIKKLQKYFRAYLQRREINATKIQSLWRGVGTRKIMSLYHNLDEFIYIISKVHFNHYSDNFYFFINQLFNVYKANTLDNNQIDSLDEEDEEKEEKEEKEDNEDSKEDEKEDEKVDDNSPNSKKYEELLNDYNDLQKKYDDLVKNKFNKPGTTKSLVNNDLASAPGETTIGTIKTDNKFPKFKGRHNISTNNINNNENLTFSNDCNDEVEVNNKDISRRFYTPNQEEEDSFNDGSKDKRFSYSSIHSEENSKYFDNEQPNKSTSSKPNSKLKNRVGILSLNKKKDKDRIFSYSPSIDVEKQSRENSSKKNNNESQIDNRITNISVIPKHIDDDNIIDPKKIEEEALDKFVNNYSKDLRIVKNNKINLENENNDDDIQKKLNCFDNELMFPENENNLELFAPRKTDEQKIKEICNDEKLYEKIKDKIAETNRPEKKELTQNYGDSFMIESKKPLNKYLDKLDNEIEQNINNLEIIQNNHRNFTPSKLDFDTNELILGGPHNLSKKKKLKKIIPVFQNEINLENFLQEKSPFFTDEKTLPSYNDNNAFTITNQKPTKTEIKPLAFNKDNMSIDNVSNNQFTIYKRPKTDREDLNRKGDEIIYLPINRNKFQRLRRSKRTKETYFTIRADPNYISPSNNKEKEKEKEKENKLNYNNNKDLIQTNENNFNIKSEYYYIEAKDEKMPNVIEQNIRDSFKGKNQNQQIKEHLFNNDDMLLSNENNFDIKADKKNKIKYFEDIETNELMIPSEKKNIKGNKDENPDEHLNTDKKEDDLKRKDRNIREINKIDEFKLEGDQKWGQLLIEVNEELSIRNDLDESNIEDNNEKEKLEDIDEVISFDIEPNEQFEIIDKIKDKKDDTPFIEDKQNFIAFKGKKIRKKEKDTQVDIAPLSIDKPKELKEEEILGEKKFLDNEITSEDLFSIYGIKDVNNANADADKKNIDDMNKNKDISEDNKKELILVKESNCELTFKKRKKKFKEIEIETENIGVFNNISPITNEEFVMKGKKIKKIEKETETDIIDENSNNINEELENIKNENIIFKGIKKKVKESETEIGNDFNNYEPISNNEIAYEPSVENDADKKEEIALEPTKVNDINLESRNRAFPKLEMNNCKYETFDGKEKEIIPLESVNNEPITYGPIDKEEISKEEPKENDDKVNCFNTLDINKTDEYNIIGNENNKKKKKIKMVENETQMDNSDNELINDNSEPLTDEKHTLRGLKKPIIDNSQNKIESQELLIEGLPKKQIELQEEKKEDLNFEPTKANDNKIFSNLDINKINEQIFNGKEKEKMILENIKNESFEFNGKEKEEKVFEGIKNESITLEGKEKENIFETINSEPLLFKGKEKEKKVFDTISNEPLLFKGKEKEKIFEGITNEPITLDGKERELVFEGITNEPITLDGKEKELVFKDIKNEPLTYIGKGKKKIEEETKIDKDLNSNLIPKNNENFTYESIKPKKEENSPVNNESINTEKSKNEFNEDKLVECFSENFAIKIKEDYEEDFPLLTNKPKVLNNLLKSGNENANPKFNNLINNLSQSVEKRLEILGNPSPTSGSRNNKLKKEKKMDEEDEELPLDIKDLDESTAKELINNIVQDKLEKEKKKNMEQTKNKLMTVIKVVKLTNALRKNTSNKKDFINKLKEIKDNNENAVNDKDDNKEDKEPEKEYVTLEDVLTGKKKPDFKLFQNYLNQGDDDNKDLSPKSLKEEDEDEKPKKFTNIEQNKINSLFVPAKKKKVVEESCQTPKLRPKKKTPKKIVLNEIKTIEEKSKEEEDK